MTHTATLYLVWWTACYLSQTGATDSGVQLLLLQGYCKIQTPAFTLHIDNTTSIIATDIADKTVLGEFTVTSLSTIAFSCDTHGDSIDKRSMIVMDSENKLVVMNWSCYRHKDPDGNVAFPANGWWNKIDDLNSTDWIRIKKISSSNHGCKLSNPEFLKHSFFINKLICMGKPETDIDNKEVPLKLVLLTTSGTSATDNITVPCFECHGGSLKEVTLECNESGEWVKKNVWAETKMTISINEAENVVDEILIPGNDVTSEQLTTVFTSINDDIEEMEPSDTAHILDVMTKLTSRSDVMAGTAVDKEVKKQIVTTFDTIQQKGDPSKMTASEKESVQEIFESVVLSLGSGEDEEIETESKTILLQSFTADGPRKVGDVELDPKDFKGQKAKVAVLDSKFKSILPSPIEKKTVNSKIFSIEFPQDATGNFTMTFPTDAGHGRRTCSFLSNEGTWKTSGCTTTKTGGKYRCNCNHYTSFAMVLSIEDAEASTTQEIMSYLFLTISIIFLTLTFVLIAPFKKLRSKDLTMAQLNIILPLTLAHLGFVSLSGTGPVNQDETGMPTLNKNAGCVAGVVIVQYLYIVAVFWMGCASWVFYGKVVNAVKSFGKKDDNFMTKAVVFCWGVPILFPTIVLVIAEGVDGDNAYLGLDQSCWPGTPWRQLALNLPIFTVLALTLVSFVRISSVISESLKSGSNTTDANYYARLGKALLGVSVCVGCPWLLAFFTIGPLALTMQILFIITVGLQGPAFFFCLVYLQDEVKAHSLSLLGISTTPSPKAESQAAKSASTTLENMSVTPTELQQKLEVRYKATESKEGNGEKKKENENEYSEPPQKSPDLL